MKSNGLATILLMIPVLTVPALAIFGIPQFAPVVASPIDESRNSDRESRGGNSSRHSQDEMFDEIEGFNSEPEFKQRSMSSLRDRSISPNPQREKSMRRADAGSASSWDLDSENGSTWPGSRRKPPVKTPHERTGRDRLFDTAAATDVPKQTAVSRTPRRLSAFEKTNEDILQQRVDDPGQGVIQSGFTEEDQFREQRRISGEENRPRPSEDLGSNRRGAGSQPLTWAAAVERLNEFDIRSFRLEPGDRSGLFVFICSYTSPDASSVSYRFEAAADEPLKAVEKVLEQIVEWRRNR